MARPVAKMASQPTEVIEEDPIAAILNQGPDTEGQEDEEPPVEEVPEEDTDQDENRAVEDLDPAVELWPGGPTAGQIVLWKEHFGDVYITSITLEKHIVWRTITRQEYLSIAKQLETLRDSGKLSAAQLTMYNEEAIAEMCILYPGYTRADFAREMAGVPSLISQQVLESSAFTSVDVRQL